MLYNHCMGYNAEILYMCMLQNNSLHSWAPLPVSPTFSSPPLATISLFSVSVSLVSFQILHISGIIQPEQRKRCYLQQRG